MTTLGWTCHTRAAPSCDMFNLGSSYFHVALTTVRHLLTVHGGIQTNGASGYAVTHAISSTGVSNLFDHWAKWSIFKEIVGLIKQISPTGLLHPTVYSDSSWQKWTETGNVWLQCSAYIVSNNLRENTHEYREHWLKFWVISWTTFCPKFCIKFCPSRGRNRCQQLCLCFRWITDTGTLQLSIKF